MTERIRQWVFLAAVGYTFVLPTIAALFVGWREALVLGSLGVVILLFTRLDDLQSFRFWGMEADLRKQVEELKLVAADIRHQVLEGAALMDYAEVATKPRIELNKLTLDLKTGNVFEVLLTENVVSMEIVNPPAPGLKGALKLILRQGEPSCTIAWPKTVTWIGHDFAPTIHGKPNEIDLLELFTLDGGETWYAMSLTEPSASDG